MRHGRDAGRRWAGVSGGAFARGVITLASGTAAAQPLSPALPLITRLYSPADYGALVVYSSTSERWSWTAGARAASVSP